MIHDIDRARLAALRNPALKSQAARYLDIYDDYLRQVRETGIEIASAEAASNGDDPRDSLAQAGARLRNDGKSILVNDSISSACLACQKGIGSATFFISLQCHRTCFYCFNPNQENYQTFSAERRNLPAELEMLRRKGQDVKHLALTGGEPLLHAAEAVEFFRAARRIYPRAHTRLYTTGDHLTSALASELREAGLDEIRFSFRMHDLEKGHTHTFDRIALAQAHIGCVMVEMPVLPDSLAAMQAVLQRLDALGVHSINLLELCYPLAQAPAFVSRGYQVRPRPYRVLYDYWYAGGLPVEGSEAVCLQLLAYAQQAGLRLGVHYCSLENKHTGQVYQQNAGRRLPGQYAFSQRDYFWKTLKVYGADVRQARKALRGSPPELADFNEAQQCLELHPSQAAALKGLDLELGLSFNIVEQRESGQVLRELKLALASPSDFDPHRDV